MLIESDIELPQLPRVSDSGAADLRIRFGRVEPDKESRSDYRRWQVYDQFRYEVIDGRDIIVEPLPGSSPNNVADAVMSRVITVAIYQRGLLPLHASAVDHGGRLLAICGPSGAGKSTLAAAFAARGAQVVADDTLVLKANGDPRDAWPGARGLKLTKEALAQHGLSAQGLALANEAEGKYFLPLQGDRAEVGSRLSLLVQILDGPPAIAPVSALQTSARWAGCIRMTDLMHVAPDPAMLWRHWLDFAARVPVVAVSHGRRMAALDGLVEQLETQYLGRQEADGE